MNPITAPTPSAAKPATVTNRVSGLTTATQQEDRFMKLLVAQMKNQDPLNPMDNAQMTSQVAQINTVGGLEKLNGTVEALLSAFQGVQAQSAMTLPGRDVLVAGTKLMLQDGAATGGVELAAPADAVTVDVLNVSGQVVQTLALGRSEAGVRSFRWDGSQAAGGTAPEGEYRLRVTAAAGSAAVEAQALVAARVLSVANTNGAVTLDLAGHGPNPWSAVRSFL